MISNSLLKEIIIANEEFILREVNRIVPRRGIVIPAGVNKTVVLYGVRRSGKTFVLFDLFRKYRERSLYIDFEDERLQGFELADFDRLKRIFLDLKPQLIGEEVWFFLDEVQNVEGWEKFCRRAVEREGIRAVVSGSSSRMTPTEIHTELRGRSWSLEMMPYSFREYLEAKGVDVADRTLLFGRSGEEVRRHFKDYLTWGGFPEVTHLDSKFEKGKLLREYYAAMYFRDLVERYQITNVPLLEALSDRLFSSFAAKLSLSSLYNQYKDRLPFSKDLLFRYYRHFLESMLVNEVRKFAESSYVRMRNPAKIYPADNGLCRRVTSADSGRLLENQVFLELKRREMEIFYFEDRKECDFVARGEGGLFLPIQVCFDLSDENIRRETDGLITAAARLDARDALLLTYDEERDMKVDGLTVRILPAWKWCLET